MVETAARRYSKKGPFLDICRLLVQCSYKHARRDYRPCYSYIATVRVFDVACTFVIDVVAQKERVFDSFLSLDAFDVTITRDRFTCLQCRHERTFVQSTEDIVQDDVR